MAQKKASAKKGAAKKAAKGDSKAPAARKKAGSSKKAAEPKGVLTRRPKAAASRAPASAGEGAAPAPAKSATKAPARRRPAGAPPVQRTRVVIPINVYEERKDEIKAPIKEQALKWTFLGEGKGLYKRADGGVHCFTQFLDDGVHYSVWGDDAQARDALLAAWRKVLGEEGWRKATASGVEAQQAEAAARESDAMRLWRLAEPQPRPGEPDLFFRKRKAEWEAKRPA